MGLKDLWSKRFRSILTISGVTIGIGSIFLLLSFGFGLQDLVQGQIIGSKSINTIDVTSTNGEVLPITQDTLNRIKALGHVSSVSGLYTYAGLVTVDGATADTVIYGVEAQHEKLSNINMLAGKFVSDKSGEIVVDNSLLQAVGVETAEEALGKEVTLETEIDGKSHKDTFRVIGVSDAGSGFEAFISQSSLRVYGVTDYTQLKAQIDDREHIPDARKLIESLGYETASPVDTLEQINQVFRYFNIILAGFGSIGLLIAVLGMLNTLTVSLLERTQEIALMLALGARGKDMRKLFITEGVILSVIGGVVGMILSTLVGMLVNVLLGEFASARGVSEKISLFSTPPLLVIGVLGFTIVVGYLVALVPARRAERINTIEALRHE